MIISYSEEIEPYFITIITIVNENVCGRFKGLKMARKVVKMVKRWSINILERQILSM